MRKSLSFLLVTDESFDKQTLGIRQLDEPFEGQLRQIELFCPHAGHQIIGKHRRPIPGMRFSLLYQDCFQISK